MALQSSYLEEKGQEFYPPYPTLQLLNVAYTKEEV